MVDSSDEELFLLDSVWPKIISLAPDPDLDLRKRKKRMGCYERNKKRRMDGEYHHLFPVLKENPSRFQSYLRMSQDTFNYILGKIESKITKVWCNFHQPILPEERLVITLRFLATGSSFKTLALNFGVGCSTVAQIVSETVTALWDELKPLHMPPPTKETFLSASDDFYNLWDFPNCLGSLEGRYIQIRGPSKSRNNRNNFSIVLQVVVDAHYKFLTINVDGQGEQCDRDNFHASGFYCDLVEKRLELPRPTALPNSNIVAPYVFIADKSYPLINHLLKPYSGTNLSPDEECFNKRISSCRKTVECAFEVLLSKWHLLTKEIETDVGLSELIVKCICVLHNTIVDRESMMHSLTEVPIENHGVVWDRAGRPSHESKSVRDIFKVYFSEYPL